MDGRPIGVFDSGLGGLTTVRELCRLLPEYGFERAGVFPLNIRAARGARSSIIAGFAGCFVLPERAERV